MAEKNIYKFTLQKSEKKQVETKRKNKETGEQEIVLTNKTVKTPVEFILKKPTRRVVDDADIQYAIELSKNIKKGIVTRAMLIKKYADTGGALTEEENKDMLKKIKRSNEIALEHEMLKATDEDEEKLNELEEELLKVRHELQGMESSLQNMYQHTADARSERSLIMWYIIRLARVIDEEKEEQIFFDGIDYEDSLNTIYEKSEEEDEFYEKAVSTFLSAMTYWHYTQDGNQKNIDEFVKQNV